MKKRTLICALLAALLCCQMTGFAADGQSTAITEQTTTHQGQYFTVRVYNPHVNPQTAGFGDICYFGEVKAGANGVISVPCIPEHSGAYKYVMVSETGEETKTGTYNYINQAAHDAAMDELDEVLQMPSGTEEEYAAKVDALEALFTDEALADLGMTADFEVYNDIKLQNCTKAYDRMIELMNDEMTAGELADIFKESMVLCAVENGQSTTVKKLADGYKELMGSQSSVINDYYDGLDDDSKDDVVEQIAGQTYESASDLAKDFADAVALEVMNGAGAWQELGSAIDKLEAESDVTIDFSELTELASKKKNSALQKLIEKIPFASADDVESKITKSIAKKPVTDGGGGGGGSDSDYIITPSVPSKPAANKPQFTDLDGVEWAKDAIIALSEKGIISGRGDGIFDPISPIKREEFTIMLVLAMDEPLDTQSDVIFSDVIDGAWYSRYIYTGVRLGVVSGRPDGLFGVGEDITRQDAAVMIARALQVSMLNAAEQMFSDSDMISDYAKGAVWALANIGVINGMGDGSFAPQKNITRAEAAKMIYNMMEAAE